MHEVYLPLDTLPLLSIAGSVTAEQDFIHQDRIIDEHVFIYLYRGEMEIIEDGIVYPLKQGEFVFLKAGVHHWGERIIPAGTCWFYVHFSLGQQLDGYRPYDDYRTVKRQDFHPEDYRTYLVLPKHANLPVHSRVDLHIKNLLELYSSSDPLRIAQVNSVLFQLFADLYDTVNYKSGNRSETILQRLIAFLETHDTVSLTSEEIALHMNLSYKYLCTLFKQKTGMTINQYHTRIRMNEAARLLRETSLNISEISYAVGYSDPLYFSNVFKKIHGVPPTQYLRYNFKKDQPVYPPRQEQ